MGDLLEVGVEVLCRWRDEKYHPAVILDVRPISSYPPSQNKNTNALPSESKAEDHLKSLPLHHSNPRKRNLSPGHEYYVHYCEFNTRLDEWVDSSRLSTLRPPLQPEQKVGVLPVSSGQLTNVNKSNRRKRKLDESGEEVRVKNIKAIELGRYEIETWYYSPYPEDLVSQGKLYICEFCLKYMKTRPTLQAHKSRCRPHHPPGRMIYEENDICVYEVDGKTSKTYCQNLCLLAKLFLDHKTLYYDVTPFYFYLLCEKDAKGAHIVGYFSKEKDSPEQYNLACILTFPPYQRSGYGKLLISISYELSKREGKVGSPEKPLSDLGKLSYRSYWVHVLLHLLLKNKGDLSVGQMSTITAITVEDIVDTLQSLDFLRTWKGKHVVTVSEESIVQFLEKAKRIRLARADNFLSPQ